MKVIVVGGAGYIGSHVALELQQQGHQVTIFDNFYSGNRKNLQPGQELIVGDLLNQQDLEQAFSKKFDAAIHLAAYKAVGESMLNPEKYSRNNIVGTLNLLEAMTKFGCQNIVFSSSAAVYGEPQYVPVDEKHPTEPENYYGFTKLEIERFLSWYSKIRGLKFASLRYFNAAGYDADGRILGLEKNPQNLLPRVLETATGQMPELSIFGNDFPTPDGTGVRDYIHVTDLAVAHCLALEKIAKTGENLIVNLGSELGISVLEVIEAARKITGKPIPAKIVGRRPGDPARIIASSSLAQSVLDWHPRHSGVEELVATAWQVYLKN